MKHIKSSIRKKLNFLLFGIILLVAAGLMAIAYYVFMDEVDDRNNERMYQAANEATEFSSGFMVEDIKNALLSDEFQTLRAKAEKEDNPALIRDWLNQTEAPGFDFDEDITVSIMDEIEVLDEELAALKDRFALDSLYIQYDKDGVTYNLVDPDEDEFWYGSAEEPIEEFEDYGNNDEIPPTIYRSKYGWLCTICVPIHDYETGETQGYIGVDLDMNEVMRERFSFVLESLLFVIILIAASLAVSTFLVRKIVSRPIRQLAEATESFSAGEDGYNKDDIISLDIRSKDEIGNLYREIRSMQERIVDYTDNITQITAERERTSTELRTAASIQKAMLPEVFPDYANRAEFELHASMTPAKEAGGDFYDFFMIDENHLGLVIADVSGKGVPAALFMMASRILLNYRSRQGGSPAEIMRAVNVEICENNMMNMFVTVWLGILDLTTGKMVCSNAGHEYPILRQNGRFTIFEDPHALFVGGRSKTNFKEYEVQLQQGDAIFVYTDGVPEARNNEKEFYGMERLEQVLNSVADASPKEILDTVEESVRSFCAGAEQFDDLTMLCLTYKG